MYGSMDRSTQPVRSLDFTTASGYFFLEAVIITGCRLGADNPDPVRQVLEELGVAGTQRDFKQDVTNGVRCYLDGYGQQFSGGAPS